MSARFASDGHGLRRTGISGPRFFQDRKRVIFRQMAAAEISEGHLPRRQRRRLLCYARSIGIGGPEAEMLIAQAEYGTDSVDPPDLTQDDLGEMAYSVSLRRAAWSRLAVIVAVIVVAQLVLFRLLSG
jgi:hypothetical protein